MFSRDIISNSPGMLTPVSRAWCITARATSSNMVITTSASILLIVLYNLLLSLYVLYPSIMYCGLNSTFSLAKASL